ncbi:MAG: histidine kinase [Kofleriaceae bacterium]|nr:histidine kinase [Kofleriaceae bacterium]
MRKGEPPFPHELFVVFGAAAPIIEYLFRRHDCTGFELARSVVAAAVPCLVVPVAVYGVYRWWVPASWRPIRRLTIHLPLVVAVATAVTFLILPLVGAIHPRSAANPVRFGFIVGIVTAVTLLPAMLLTEGRRARELAEVRAREERQARLEAQLAALQARTSPHFLFNTLNTVASLIHDNPDLAEATLERLATVFRHALEGSRAASVPIERELAVCEDYLEIQAARFGDRFAWRVEVAPGARGRKVVPMVIQPLVENAVLHSAARRTHGGHIEIAVTATSDAITCTVTDNGTDGSDAPHPGGGGSGTSLADLRARLALVPGGAFATEQLDGGGFRASVVLPAPVAA